MLYKNFVFEFIFNGYLIFYRLQEDHPIMSFILNNNYRLALINVATQVKCCICCVVIVMNNRQRKTNAYCCLVPDIVNHFEPHMMSTKKLLILLTALLCCYFVMLAVLANGCFGMCW
jgi:hypothetical protein